MVMANTAAHRRAPQKVVAYGQNQQRRSRRRRAGAEGGRTGGVVVVKGVCRAKG